MAKVKKQGGIKHGYSHFQMISHAHVYVCAAFKKWDQSVRTILYIVNIFKYKCFMFLVIMFRKWQYDNVSFFAFFFFPLGL